MDKHRQLTIAEMGGLPAYIDSTKDQNNGHDHADWERAIQEDKVTYGKPNVMRLAKLFNKNPHTIRKWLKVRELESASQ